MRDSEGTPAYAEPPTVPRRTSITMRAEYDVDEELAHEMRLWLANRLAAESPFSELAHVALVAIASAMAAPYVPRRDITLWILAVLIAALGRGFFRRRAARSGNPDHAFNSVRLGVTALGVAWGVGVMIIGPDLPPDVLAWVTVIFAGIISGATVSLLPDAFSFNVLLATLLIPLTIAVGRDGPAPSALHILVVVFYGGAMSFYFRRSHKALLEQFSVAKRLEITERASQHERAMLDALVDGAPSAIAVIDPDGLVIRVNHSFEKTFGFAIDDVLGHSLNNFLVPSADRDNARDLDRRVASGETVTTEVVRRRRDGSAITVRLAATRVHTASKHVTFVLYDDITEARRTRDAERSLVGIIEATTDFVGMASPQGPMTYLNAAGRRMLGVPADLDLTGMTFMDLCVPRLHDTLMNQFLPVAMRDGSWSGEFTLCYRGGTEVPVSMVVLAHRAADGSIARLAAIARDVTQQVATREALSRARDAAEEATQVKSTLLANTSHEIRTPLNGILGMVELLLDTELTPSQRRSVELIQGSGESLLSTMNDLLDLSKIEAANLELEDISFDLHHVLNSAGRLFMPRATQRGIELVIDMDAGVPQQVRGDPHRLRQVLTNLVGNAIKFTERGEVALSVRVMNQDAARARLRFAVRDTGIGIESKHLVRIFEPFHQVDASTTRQYGGTGLGLSIARRLVELMGGDLAVESAPGTGSEFHFTIDVRLAPDDAVAAPNVVTLAQLHVLVVDDHPTNRRILGDMLRWAGCVALEMPDAASALEELRAAKRRSDPYRLVVSDVQMPLRDGFQLAADIRADNALRDTRIMLFTSAGQRGDGQRCRELGVAAYMQKPVSRVELLEAAVAALRDPVSAAARTSLVTRHTIDEARRRLRILVAEDNAVNQEVALAMLRKRGHDVTVVDDGRAAVDAVRKGPAFDVVLMDLQMPELDGIGATREIRASGDTTPIVALTANVLLAERERCFEAGMSGYLAKPFKAHELFAAVEGWSTTDTPAGGVRAQTTAPVDLDAFHAMLGDAGIASTGSQMLRVFLSHSAERMEVFRNAVRESDTSDAERVAHMLKSSAGTISATRLAELFRQAEAAAQSVDMQSVAMLGEKIDAEYGRVVAFLNHELGNSD